MFQAILEKSNALKAQVAELRKEAAAHVKPLLMDFMKQHPQVKAVKWTQYTPYFNDGDACTFSVNEPTFYFEGEDPEEDDGHEVWCMNPGRERNQYAPTVEQCSQETLTACYELNSALQGIDDALEELFGDHVRVTVTADGVEVDEYDHD